MIESQQQGSTKDRLSLSLKRQREGGPSAANIQKKFTVDHFYVIFFCVFMVLKGISRRKPGFKEERTIEQRWFGFKRNVLGLIEGGV